MIELDYPRERMLADIRATEGAVLVSSFADAAARDELVAREHVRLVTKVGTPQEILASLESALARRFAAEPPESLRRDLLAPLKKALGNAHKRGNRMDPAKRITLELVLTPSGAFVEVSDEGEGFDVAETCARFAAGSRYFAHHGSGFRKFHKARSVIGFADGGRTFRACFVSAAEGALRPRGTHRPPATVRTQ